MHYTPLDMVRYCSFLRVYGPRQSLERGQYSAILTEQAWLITHMYVTQLQELRRKS